MHEGTGKQSFELPFGDKERLQLHQYRILEWLESQRSRDRSDAALGEEAQRQCLSDLDDAWQLLQGIRLSAWQEDCKQAWFRNQKKGTVKVVTGAGKTILALAIVEQLQNEQIRDLRVAIVVPTIVLMNQWYDQFVATSNLPLSAIGRLGGGYRDSFADGRRVMIAVLDSAQKELPSMVEAAGVGDRLILVADECHRAGAPLMSRVLKTPRIASLGLSATPEREEDGEAASVQEYADSILGRELGPLIYELTLAQALALGIVPPYTIKHYGLELNAEERAEYDRLSRSISDAREELQRCAGPKVQTGARFFSWIQKTAEASGTEVGALAMRFLQDTAKRKALLYGAEARFTAVQQLLSELFLAKPDSMALLFHESIESVNALFVRLYQAGFQVVLEHSQLPQEIRDHSLDLFRKGLARVLVSAKSLIEGFNVPAVDTGIVVASSTSVRQRIQSLGRVLRKFRTATGEEKSPTVHVLYVRDTVDELIYEREDWNRLTGADRNLYFNWRPDGQLVEQPGPPRICLPSEVDVDPSLLVPGGIYPGRLEGEVLSCDSNNNVRDAEGNLVPIPREIVLRLRQVLGRPGRFFLTPLKKHCIVRVPAGDEWETRYLGSLTEAPSAVAGGLATDEQRREWLRQARPGVPYPFAPSPPLRKYKFSLKKRGVIVEKRDRGEAFAAVGPKALDPQKGKDALSVLEAVRVVRALGHTVTWFFVDATGVAIYPFENVYYFLAEVKHGFEFPE